MASGFPALWDQAQWVIGYSPGVGGRQALTADAQDLAAASGQGLLRDGQWQLPEDPVSACSASLTPPAVSRSVLRWGLVGTAHWKSFSLQTLKAL